MNEKYKNLFTLISQSVEVLAEEAMALNKKEGKDKEYNVGEKMLKKYRTLTDNIKKDNPLDKNDYIDIYIGAMLVCKQIESRISKEKLALDGYKIDLIPKLKMVIDEGANPSEIFLISDN